MKKILTLCIIEDGSRILLGMKKRGFGAGRWNGFGGKLEPGESVEAGVKRELLEEAGLSVNSMEQTGIIEFELRGDPQILQVHVFRGSGIVGDPAETEEMRPKWFGIDEIPYHEMWPDDRYWLPLFLNGKKFNARFLFEGQDKILEHEIKLV